MFYGDNSAFVFTATLHTYICTFINSFICSECFRITTIHIYTTFPIK
nr:MAG TPA: hypothetical protein [Caudoviricetes sp.]